LIGNTRLLRENKQALNQASIMLELIEARKQARNRSLLTAHLQTETLEEMQHNFARLNQRLNHLVSGLEFQTAHTEREYTAKPCHYTISGVTNVGGSATDFLEIVAVLRSAGAVHINITPLTYRFENESSSVRTLNKRLKRKH
jgi:ATP phosphoribosyltransferase